LSDPRLLDDVRQSGKNHPMLFRTGLTVSAMALTGSGPEQSNRD